MNDHKVYDSIAEIYKWKLIYHNNMITVGEFVAIAGQGDLRSLGIW